MPRTFCPLGIMDGCGCFGTENVGDDADAIVLLRLRIDLDLGDLGWAGVDEKDLLVLRTDFKDVLDPAGRAGGWSMSGDVAKEVRFVVLGCSAWGSGL